MHLSEQKKRITFNRDNKLLSTEMSEYSMYHYASGSQALALFGCSASYGLSGCKAHSERATVDFNNDLMPTSFTYEYKDDTDSNECRNLKKIK